MLWLIISPNAFITYSLIMPSFLYLPIILNRLWQQWLFSLMILHFYELLYPYSWMGLFFSSRQSSKCTANLMTPSIEISLRSNFFQYFLISSLQVFSLCLLYRRNVPYAITLSSILWQRGQERTRGLLKMKDEILCRSYVGILALLTGRFNILFIIEPIIFIVFYVSASLMQEG